MKINLEGKVALVTGSSRGIGLACAQELGLAGAKIIVNSRNEKTAQHVANQLTSEGIEAIGLGCDVSSFEQSEKMFKAIANQWGGVDILVNNAGINKDTLFLRMSVEDWDKVLTINLNGTFNCTKLALRAMLKKRWGRIINMSSISGVSGNMGQTNYSAAKAGLNGFTKSLARELGSRSITVNAIAPGFIDTDMTLALSDEIKNSAQAQIPLKRFGLTQEVAFLTTFLASEQASYITGQVLQIDGGLTM